MRIDRIAQALHEGGVAQRQTAALRRLHGLDRAGDKTGGADPLEDDVAAEIVAARPHWSERRLQPHLQLDKAADRGRGAVAHRQPNLLQPDLRSRTFPLDNAQHQAVGALANIAGLDKA